MTNFADILGLGVPELLIILVILLLFFGGRKLPELSRNLGTSLKELRKGINSDDVSEKKTGTTKSDKVR